MITLSSALPFKEDIIDWIIFIRRSKKITSVSINIPHYNAKISKNKLCKIGLNTNLQYLSEGHFELDDVTINNADTPMMYARNGVKINYAQSCTNHPRSGVITIFLTLKVNDLYAAQYAFCGQTIYYRFRDDGSMGAWEVLN